VLDGNQDDEVKEQRLLGFSDGLFQYLAAKPVMAGAGCNFQRHCRKAVFVGIGFKFHDFIQAIHRIHRFGQAGVVEIDVIYAESEREVRAELERKWAQHNEMVAKMARSSANTACRARPWPTSCGAAWAWSGSRPRRRWTGEGGARRYRPWTWCTTTASTRCGAWRRTRST
jgi:hypothetical protein